MNVSNLYQFIIGTQPAWSVASVYRRRSKTESSPSSARGVTRRSRRTRRTRIGGSMSISSKVRQLISNICIYTAHKYIHILVVYVCPWLCIHFAVYILLYTFCCIHFAVYNLLYTFGSRFWGSFGCIHFGAKFWHIPVYILLYTFCCIQFAVYICHQIYTFRSRILAYTIPEQNFGIYLYIFSCIHFAVYILLYTNCCIHLTVDSEGHLAVYILQQISTVISFYRLISKSECTMLKPSFLL